MYYLGFDPGAKDLAWAVIDDTPKLLAVGVLKSQDFVTLANDFFAVAADLESICEFTQYTLRAAAVESQQIYEGPKRKGDPNNLIGVAHTTGMLVGHMADYCCKVYVPLPRDWKGQTSKKINQRRSYEALGLGFEVKGTKDPYCVPVGYAGPLFGVKGYSDWYHMGDAVGLALYARRMYAAQQD